MDVSTDTPRATVPVSGTRKAETSAETGIGARQLAQAVELVVADWNPSGDMAVQQSEWVEQLQVVAYGGIAENDGTSLGPGEVALRIRLIGLLRAQLIRVWTTAEAEDQLDAREMLSVLERLESNRRALEPSQTTDVRSMLLQPSALEVLVEIAHDLRSPLTSILFLSDSLGRGHSGSINDVQHQQLGIIYSAALGLLSVASDVVELARDGDRLSEQEFGPFSLLELFASVRDMVQPVAEQKGLALRILPAEPDQRLGYAVALSRVLLNLTTNALKYTEQGVVEIVARPQGRDRIEFSVRDTGEGIDADLQQVLFRPFPARRKSSRFSFSQTGLGLSICRKLVRAMGSELHMETAKGWGTRFFFELAVPPYLASVEPSAASSQSRTAPPLFEDISARRSAAKRRR
jgi:signal transduction histidine kinase